ncbi:ATP-grasp domain-containing protein [Parvularcula lutaonensis]|uniref:RimK family alpha-L-glutamate ligase n=1 Tax=Parvularcula lutaonensis TaxID=491923 RepID=A0ABV7MEB6_9PROT|nr:transporter [Parvularcula lutaonensis]GGY54355.1 transporter [Parvularcula lutaonensis]
MTLTILVPDGGCPLPWRAHYDRLQAALASASIQTQPAPWPELPATGAATPLLAWGYHLEAETWDRALGARDPVAPTLNALGILRWNSDKRYLRDVERRTPIVPTVFAETVTDETARSVRQRFGRGPLIAKPFVGGTAYGVRRAEDAAELVGAERVLIQPFLDEITAFGEISIMVFAGRYSHAVLKTAANGEFRVQSDFGGRVEAFEPPAPAIGAAMAALTACPEPPVYARVDLVPHGGGWAVMELELIEPELFLDHAPDRGAAMAKAFAEALRQ